MTLTAAAPPRPLSPRQREAFDWIRAYFKKHQTSPTLQELADGLGVSRVSSFEHVKELERKGWVVKERNAMRSIKPVGVCPGCGQAFGAHERAAERILMLEQALTGLVDAVVKDSANNGVSGFTGARLADARTVMKGAAAVA